MWVVNVITGTTVPKRSVSTKEYRTDNQLPLRQTESSSAAVNEKVERAFSIHLREPSKHTRNWTASPTFVVNLFLYLVQQMTNSFFSFIYYIYIYIYISREKITKVLLFWGERMVNRVWCSHDHSPCGKKEKAMADQTTKPFVSFGSLEFLILLLYRMCSSFVCFYFHV